eukprot:ANDGO_02716.mRNA.1 Ras-related protein Rab-32A
MSGRPPSEINFKIIVVGESGIGKTAFIKMCTYGVFTNSYKATIGVDFSLKTLSWDDGTVIRLQLWDISGQERFGNMTRVFYRDAVGAFVMHDLSKRDTLDASARWKNDVDAKVMFAADGRPIPCVLVGTKSDLPSLVGYSQADLDAWCADRGFYGHIATSAKNNYHLDEALAMLTRAIMERLAAAGLRKPILEAPTVNAVQVASSRNSQHQQHLREEKKGCC